WRVAGWRSCGGLGRDSRRRTGSLASPDSREKILNRCGRLARLFHLNVMARACNHRNRGAGDALTEEPRVLRRRELILVAADDERRRTDRGDALHDVEPITRLQIDEDHASHVVA